MPNSCSLVNCRRPSHGTKRRWSDVAATDVKSVNAGAEWYDLAQDRNAWAAVGKAGIASSVDQHRYGTYAANLSRLNRLATIPDRVDGHSDTKETVPGTAACVAVLL